MNRLDDLLQNFPSVRTALLKKYVLIIFFTSLIFKTKFSDEQLHHQQHRLK